ncbi:MAG: hypothetical protein U5K54_10640 [Cytophagales bacterium]|nr:hypothetical protein [Cytophagales bacterium]
MIDINRGNRFTQLVSYSTKARGLHNYVVKTGGADHPNAKIDFKLGDVVTTMISTLKGETILLQHDTNLPRPYSLGIQCSRYQRNLDGCETNQSTLKGKVKNHISGKMPKSGWINMITRFGKNMPTMPAVPAMVAWIGLY